MRVARLHEQARTRAHYGIAKPVEPPPSTVPGPLTKLLKAWHADTAPVAAVFTWYETEHLKRLFRAARARR